MRIIQGDCVIEMSKIQAGSIDLTVTSPPYDKLRTYNGYSFDFESVAKELFRITKNGGVVVWVVGDGTENGSESGTSFRQALFFKECGFRLYDTMIWEKDALAFPDTRRYQQCFEYMFVLSKGAPVTTNIIKDRKNVSFGRTITGTSRKADGTTSIIGGYGKAIQEFGLRWNVWKISNEKGTIRKEHPAVFPEQLAQDHILSWSNAGDVVLDPFLGSGTTGKMAVLNGRDFIGIDISPEYCELARKRIDGEKNVGLFSEELAL